ncbi:MAG: hypothetical protein HY340_02945 [Candidatus Kerfeldbacteria bacterium]|nr:hypothetical protein [Candidatus Kerfeldbacteria bacterium]
MRRILRSELLLGSVFVLLLIMIFLVAPAVDAKKDARTQFELVFGTSPADSITAQWAVTHSLQTLLDLACDTAKEWQAWPTDNYSLETIANANLRRLELQVALAQEFGFQVPPEYERFQLHPKWKPNPSYGELDCY